MITKELKMAITEVVEILNLASDDELKKIPMKFINFLKQNVDKEYHFEIEENKKINEINLSSEAKNILAMIAYNYLSSNEEEKKNIEVILNNNQKEYEKKYNPDNLFKNNIIKEEKYNVIEDEENVDLVVYKENIFQRFVKFIKKFLKNKI